MIEWTYPTMYQWYLKHQDRPVDTIHCIMYDSVRSSADNKDLEPFIKRNIIYIGKCEIQNVEMFPNGLFTVLDDNKKLEMNLHFVFPLYKQCKGKQLPLADHFRFVYNERSVKQKTNFHLTRYVCSEMRPNHYEYLTNHKKDNFPDKLDMPRRGDVIGLFNKDPIQYYKKALIDLIRYPWTHDMSGAGRTEPADSQTQPRRPVTSQAFSELWRRAELRRMTAFGFKHADGTIIWSVSFQRKGRTLQNEAYTAYVFDTATDDERHFQDRLAQLANQE